MEEEPAGSVGRGEDEGWEAEFRCQRRQGNNGFQTPHNGRPPASLCHLIHLSPQECDALGALQHYHGRRKNQKYVDGI